MHIDDIKKALVSSCIRMNSFLFIPFLISKKVKTNFQNKWRFYFFYRYMLKSVRQENNGILVLKIEQPFGIDDVNVKLYNFYDNCHKYARLTIVVTEKNNEIHLDVMPF